MNRREAVRLLGGALVAWPFAGRAQESDRPRRVGVLMLPAEDATFQSYLSAFEQVLQQRGWRIGQNMIIDGRLAKQEACTV